MANPNLVAVTSILGKSIQGALTTTVTTDLLTCASDKLLKVNSIFNQTLLILTHPDRLILYPQKQCKLILCHHLMPIH